MVNTAYAQQPNPEGRRFSSDAVLSVAPALEHYTQDHLYGDVWKRPGLNSRDRSLVTIAALIARGEADALNYYADQARKRREASRNLGNDYASGLLFRLG